MRKSICHLSLALLCLALHGGILAEPPIPDDPYNILKEIPSFYELFNQKGLTAYSADVKIEGAVTQTLLTLTAEKKLPPPEFIEYYTPKDGFWFGLKNTGYPALLKQIICEMFTPVQIFERVILLMESKRELSWFQNFKAVTRVEAKWIQYQEAPHIKLVFTASPENPIEKLEEKDSANFRTIITHGMTFIIQPSTKMIRVMKVDQTEKTRSGETKIEKKFLFEYQKTDARVMPSELRIEKNGREEVKLQASYTANRDFIVYTKKVFTFTGASGKPEAVRMHYGNYRFNTDVDFSYLDEGKVKGSSMSNETAAEKLYNKAKDLIINGKTREATQILKKIIKEYATTSYAEQAKTLLDGLPE